MFLVIFNIEFLLIIHQCSILDIILTGQGLTRKIPVVCLVLEGGKNTINVVLESVRQNPPIPVIVIDGSGRAADLLAFAHQYADDDG